MESKICAKCSVPKLLSEFYFRKDLGKHRNNCIACESIRLKQYYEKNIEERIESSHDYYHNNKEICKNRNKKYVETHRVENRAAAKIWRAKNRDIRYSKYKLRKQTDSVFKIKCNIHSLIITTFKKTDLTKKYKSVEILGCSMKEFHDYIEQQFEPWMNWSNYGKYIPGTKTWQLDHIIPMFFAKTEEDVILLNHYTNFRPLESELNNRKGNKWNYC